MHHLHTRDNRPGPLRYRPVLSWTEPSAPHAPGVFSFLFLTFSVPFCYLLSAVCWFAGCLFAAWCSMWCAVHICAAPQPFPPLAMSSSPFLSSRVGSPPKSAGRCISLSRSRKRNDCQL